ncbi:hypothetical protein [Nonomuraea gerenzanensis]|uniref:Uncharacterized protein n=1 Tax=Nonomuraea gerenzanensis TaxID=93944 RepID=A0A1M4E544_9ACTN|nr:hypothetical protein [Nonomuraea gerenzanensis]UBU16105.1 hypothetical protein LCN96_14160 [Nonomuraea gerenzanensis]SBO93910.1 hypothetical protein BN4615_P3426 [Nonomuraea gerenzanensis]
MRYYPGAVGPGPERDVEPVPLGGGPALPAALEKGRIDAYRLSPPAPYAAERSGGGRGRLTSPGAAAGRRL